MTQKTGFLAILTLTYAMTAWSQPAVDLPRQSPAASVSQTFGYTSATVKYSRPAVNERVIWGGLVPYGQVWRAGANEPTTIEFTRDVAVNGQALAAGSYGFFVLPENNADKKAGKKTGGNTWTFIFSRNTKGWGAYGYDAKDDALRVTITPEKAPHTERMTFVFDAASDAGATLSLNWEKLRGSLNITAEFLETAKANIVAGLPKAKADDPYAWLQSARFYWVHQIDRKQALEWVDKSIAVKAVHANLWTKAQWLAESKQFAEAQEAGKLARAEALKDPGLASQVPAMDKTMKAWK
jgi:Protein of unknown function (DUF2911)